MVSLNIVVGRLGSRQETISLLVYVNNIMYVVEYVVVFVNNSNCLNLN
jgi:hypothetical protein